MIALWIYLGLCFLWSCFAIYKQNTSYSLKSSFGRYVFVFFLNLCFFPAMLCFAITKQKLLHKHNWVYHNYVPYEDKMTPHGAGYRKCTKCNKTETSWS